MYKTMMKKKLIQVTTTTIFPFFSFFSYIMCSSCLRCKKRKRKKGILWLSSLGLIFFHHRLVHLLNVITEINLTDEDSNLSRNVWKYETLSLHFFWTLKPTKYTKNIQILILRVDISPVYYYLLIKLFFWDSNFFHVK